MGVVKFYCADAVRFSITVYLDMLLTKVFSKVSNGGKKWIRQETLGG